MRAIQVAIPHSRRVLDFGCGTGWVLGEAEVSGNPFRVGLDLCFRSLQAARRYPAIHFVCGNGLHLPFADRSFDVITGHVSMPYMNTAQALRELNRVLAPGGSILLTFHNFHYLLDRMRSSVRTRNVKDLVYCTYMGLNGALNHFGLPQSQIWWRPAGFETVNTAGGVHRSCCQAGFNLVSVEYAVDRIFFAVTARKPDPETGKVHPAPGWAVYSGLRSSAREPVKTAVASR